MSRHTIVLLSMLTLALAAGATPASAQTEPASRADVGALKGEIERLKTELEGIRGELRAIRELLTQRAAQPAAPPRVVSKVRVAGHPALGKSDAPVTMVEFSDYQCPFCRRFFDSTLPAIKKDYVDSGKVRYVFRDFPLDQIHPQARKAAEAALCAGEQGKFWEMHDQMFKNQGALQVEQLRAHARGLGVDGSAFDECLDKGKHAATVQRNFDEGVSAGVRGTPAFFIGTTRPDGTVEGMLISGAQPLAQFKGEIDRLLADK